MRCLQFFAVTVVIDGEVVSVVVIVQIVKRKCNIFPFFFVVVCGALANEDRELVWR